MALSPVIVILSGVFGLLLIPTCVTSEKQANSYRFSSGKAATEASSSLRTALRLSDLYNWADAESYFVTAERLFAADGDKRNALYAHLGFVRSTSEQRNLPRTSASLAADLTSNQLLKTDKQLRMFCLIIKGDVDQEIDSRVSRDDWTQVQHLAAEQGDLKWSNRALAQLGIAAFYDGDLRQASQDIGTAVAVATKTGDIGAQIRYTAALGYGFVTGKMYEQALPYFSKALALTKQAPDSGYPYVINEFRLEALLGLHLFDEADQLANEMLLEARKTKRVGRQASALTFTAQIALARGDSGKAIGELRAAINFYRKSGFQQLLESPQSMLSEIYRREGNLSDAEQLAMDAAHTAQANGNRWSLPQRLQALGRLQAARGKYTDADRTYQRATAFVDSGLAKSSSALEKMALIKASGSLYPEHFDLLATRLRSPERAYSLVEEVRGRVNVDLLQAGSVISANSESIERRIAALQLTMMSAKSTEEISKLRDQIFSVEELRWVSPGINILKKRANAAVPLTEVRKLLDESTVLLEYVLAEPRSFCIAISREGFDIVSFEGESEIDLLVSAYLDAVARKTSAQNESRHLFNVLLAPIRQIKDKRNIIIVRDGKLHLLPFDALTDTNGKYVLETKTVAYAPSATTYYLLSKDVSRAKSATSLLAVGAVPYSRLGVHSVSVVRGSADSILRDLPYSREEVLNAASAFTGRRVLLLDEKATESAFKREVRNKFGTIHIAVHGFANNSDPNKAALVLFPDPSAKEDGLLQASEIAMMHIESNLVILSACETAVGPIQGQEGISTLSRSFLLAGAKSVISTLWPVDDAASQSLMKDFYVRFARGVYPSLALAEAKRTMRANHSGKAVPFYWAGLTFEGAF